jgi:hypothetical protein
MSVAAPGLSPIIDRLGFNLNVEMNSSGVDVSIDKDHVAVADPNTGDLGDITKEELDQVAYGQPTIRFMDEDDKRFTVYAPEGKTHFTVSDLLDAIVAFEQHNRLLTDWFGSVDCHHVWFAGMGLTPLGTACITWDS